MLYLTRLRIRKDRSMPENVVGVVADMHFTMFYC